MPFRGCLSKTAQLITAFVFAWGTLMTDSFAPSHARYPSFRQQSIGICHASRLDKGFNLLEIASGVLPQGAIVQTAKEGWKFAWQRMMAELAPQDKQGNYQRPSYPFQGRIGTPEFPDEPGRYHLYVGNPCPWCHRTKIAVNVLEFGPQQIGVTLLQDDPVKASRGGWVFSASQPDPLGNGDLRELYNQLSPGYQRRCTAPLLVDKKARKIVSNESSDIVRMLNHVKLGRKDDKETINLYPGSLAKEIDETNQWTYELVNNAVYRCGFSTTQAAYDRASADVRQGLERCESILKEQNYLCGDSFTEADLRLLPTILRFDGAYAPLFRAGGSTCRIGNYPSIEKWLQRCWSLPGVPASIDISDACSSYFKQLFPLNAGGIIPTPATPQSLGLES